MNHDDIATTSTEDLVDWFNANSKRKVKGFADRPTAEKRVSDLIDRLAAKAEAEVEKAKTFTPEELEARQEEIRQKRREGTSRSWTDPDVRAARTQRHGVEVDGVYYSSVAEAFRVLGLDMKKCIEFRGELKKAGEDTAAYKNPETGEFLHWVIVPFRKAVPKKKVKPEPTDVEGAPDEAAEATSESAEPAEEGAVA